MRTGALSVAEAPVHHGSFDAFKLDDPALRALALIVRGADTADRDLTTGFQATSNDDFENMARQFP